MASTSTQLTDILDLGLAEFDLTIESRVDVCNFDLFGMDNIFFDVALQEQPVLVTKTSTSPFHQSDSGLSEMSEAEFNETGSVDSSGSEQSRGEQMLDHLVESMEFSPFCEAETDRELHDYINGTQYDGADQDLVGYLTNESSCSRDSSDLATLQAMVAKNPQVPTVVPVPNKENKIINYKTRSASKGKSGPKSAQSKFPKVVLKPSNSKVEADSQVAVLEDKTSTGLKSIKVLKVIKNKTVSEEDTAAQVVMALDDRNRKNAINAKMNREKKKAYVNQLENELEEVKDSNAKLIAENNILKNEKLALQEQVEYFKNVLANQSTLSKVLSTMENLKGVKLTSSIAGGSKRKHSALNSDHSYGSKSQKMDETETASGSHGKASAGICLHVHEDTVSLEFCPHCSNMAKSVE